MGASIFYGILRFIVIAVISEIMKTLSQRSGFNLSRPVTTYAATASGANSLLLIVIVLFAGYVFFTSPIPLIAGWRAKFFAWLAGWLTWGAAKLTVPILVAVLCLPGCFSDSPSPDGESEGDTPIEREDDTPLSDTASIREVFRKQSKTVRAEYAATYEAIAEWIEKSPDATAVSSIRLLNRAIEDHYPPLPKVDGLNEAGKAALSAWTDPDNVPSDWKRGLPKALRQIAAEVR